jgi:hypothetical protein
MFAGKTIIVVSILFALAGEVWSQVPYNRLQVLTRGRGNHGLIAIILTTHPGLT